MSESKDQHLESTSDTVSSKLHICLFSIQPQFSESVARLLPGDRYKLKCFDQTKDLTNFVIQNKEQIDCIVLTNHPQLSSILPKLWESQILLPTVIVETEKSIKEFVDLKAESNQSLKDITKSELLYHQAEIRLYPTQLKEINSYINLAITKFINLAPDSEINAHLIDRESDSEKTASKSLTIQQRRLTGKIKERLGYLGVYYKRNTNDFYHNLNKQNQANLVDHLIDSYRQILLNYFEDGSPINQLIDEFVDRVFFADVSTSQILEIHMDLIDEFSHQLQIEGRSDDILLDYRLPLIDVLSHLCEMYRRSIPGKDISWELLFGVK